MLNQIAVNVNMVLKETSVNMVSELEGIKFFMLHLSLTYLNRYRLILASVLFIDALPDNLLSGPNVCERVEMREEMERIIEQELVETSYKEWCWPKIRCTHTKIEQMPVEKQKKAIKPYPVKYCCHGYAKNYKGNRCLPIENTEDVQQQVVQ